ncbi:phosphate starvation-inducible protein PhoH [Marinococcus halophilus]|uniref:PhoH-like protein n=1 Tax=Marinococcus halophilus TaxID=1371 RepID=A0A510Y5W2_MARHA|nr:PhoH family protein [Marinococcus halophilus]OZT81039.1 phosphate starvation-inducible protein PhoH [Marinococcus halophilus]GEK58748.1 phosphate starvation protein PhoH [Marinococcus halophilus]
MTEKKTLELQVNEMNDIQQLFGPNDVHIERLEEKLDVSIITRGGSLIVEGDEKQAALVEEVIEALARLLKKRVRISERDVVYAAQLAEEGKLEKLEDLFQEQIAINAEGKPVMIKTLGQKEYIDQIRRKDMIFGVGPAGTGKTYLAVVMAVNALKEGRVKRIVLTRPAVEAGESLGFLPGDLKEKVDPYLRPLYDALHNIFGAEHTQRLMERGTIEVAPLAYMRGRTLDDAFVILDEAQNTTKEQIKMFLTRLGFGSKMIVNGDLTQIDLPKGQQSGLKVAARILRSIDHIGFVYLEATDVVRHTLVQQILDAYEQEEGDPKRTVNRPDKPTNN